MGVGYPLDLVVCVALGVDMFDCVYPTRTARFGVALVPQGTMRLKSKDFETDLQPVQVGCKCTTCQSTSRAMLHMLFKENNPLASQLLTKHNIFYMMTLMRSMRQAILQGEEAVDSFINNFLSVQFPENKIPQWVLDALQVAEVCVDPKFSPMSAQEASTVEQESNSNALQD